MIIFGGRSVEHDISIITGLGVLNNISHAYHAVPVYIDKDGQWWTGDKLFDIKTFQPFSKQKLYKCTLMPNKNCLIIFTRFGKKQKPIYCAVNCLHGLNGEDGTMAGLLELCNIPHTGQSVLCGALCMDKTATKQVMAHNKIKIVEYIKFEKTEYDKNKTDILCQIDKKIGYPCIIKPNKLGSSIGINVAQNEWECEKHIEQAMFFDNEILVEKYLAENKELNIAVMQSDNEIMVSNIEEVQKANNLYDFNKKYKDKNIKRIVPAQISSALQTAVQKTATKAYKILGCSGVARFDFLYSEKTLYLNEINTIPGSLACYLWKEPKLAFNVLIDKLIQNAVQNFNYNSKKELNFETDVLKSLTQDSFIMTK